MRMSTPSKESLIPIDARCNAAPTACGMRVKNRSSPRENESPYSSVSPTTTLGTKDGPRSLNQNHHVITHPPRMSGAKKASVIRYMVTWSATVVHANTQMQAALAAVKRKTPASHK